MTRCTYGRGCNSPATHTIDGKPACHHHAASAKLLPWCKVAPLPQQEATDAARG